MSALTELERKALFALAGGVDGAWEGEHWCYPFKAIAEQGQIPTHLVRRTVRRLARKGFAEYRKGLWTEDGEPAGAGYCLSEAGATVVHAVHAIEQLANELHWLERRRALRAAHEIGKFAQRIAA